MTTTNDAPVAITPASLGKARFDFGKSVWLWFMILMSLLVGLPNLNGVHFFTATLLGCLTVCLGHSVGLHRGLIHQSYQTSVWLKRILVYLMTLTGLGGPISWARLHAIRDYWQNQPSCPRYFAYRHHLGTDFWWNLHLRFESNNDQALQRLPKGILEDPFYRFLELTWPLHQLPLALAVGYWLGPEAIASVICGRIAVTILGHWLIGYASHVWGHQPHTVPLASEHGRNNWALGVISFGEGFHNNHHAFPTSARMGLKPWEWDLGWLVILAMQRLGLVHDVQVARPKKNQAANEHISSTISGIPEHIT